MSCFGGGQGVAAFVVGVAGVAEGRSGIDGLMDYWIDGGSGGTVE